VQKTTPGSNVVSFEHQTWSSYQCTVGRLERAWLRAFESVHEVDTNTAVCFGSPLSPVSVSFDILSSIVITIAPRDAAPSLLEDLRRIKPCTCFEATERA
jgi:hypothetical protein